MKKNIFYAIAASILFIGISSYTNPNPKNSIGAFIVTPPTQTVTNVTNGVTTTFKYFSGNGIYTTLKSTINGHTVYLTNISHSGGTINIDKWTGVIDGFTVNATVQGTQYQFWAFGIVTVIQMP